MREREEVQEMLWRLMHWDPNHHIHAVDSPHKTPPPANLTWGNWPVETGSSSGDYTLTCVEPCLGFDIHRNRETKRLELVQRPRKCLYVYQYWEHPVLGWLHART